MNEFFLLISWITLTSHISKFNRSVFKLKSDKKITSDGFKLDLRINNVIKNLEKPYFIYHCHLELDHPYLGFQNYSNDQSTSLLTFKTPKIYMYKILFIKIYM